jgi:DNA polymerase I-like protein with 3'-5' exonuclease and polymerase domains
VDPLTRKVQILPADLKEIRQEIDRASLVVCQNAKFDVSMLVHSGLPGVWPWEKTVDTLLAGHMLASNQPHDLTTMALVYLSVNIKPLEDALKQAVKEARTLAKAKYPDWRIAREGLEEMPSTKGKVGNCDFWLPRAIAQAEGYPEDHPWWTVCTHYCNGDTGSTLPLFLRQKQLIEQRGLWRIYEERLKLLPIVTSVEGWGVTVSQVQLEELRQEYEEQAVKAHATCIRMAGKDAEGKPNIDKLPLSGASNALKHVVYDVFKLVSNKTTDKGNASMDGSVLEHWITELSENSKAHRFIKNFLAYRKRKAAQAFMASYEKFWVPTGVKSWYRLHPHLNPTGTFTLRWSSNSPNEQQISKKEGFNLRRCFGPAPGREWWSLDAKNIELRIPAFESGEQELIGLFMRPDEPPFYGSNHLLNFATVYPDVWARELEAVGIDKVGPHCKEKYLTTNYHWAKCGGFAIQYGAMEETADKTFRRKGSYGRLKERFSKLNALNRYWTKHAKEHGYVETMPDKTVDPDRGYPLMCTRGWGGHILPTVPLNYHIQGTACWWMMKAMIRCYAYLRELNAASKPDNYRMVMQVHDELVFDFPREKTPQSNLPKIKEIQRLMELGGDDLGLPTPTSCSRHDVSWGDEESA